MHAARIIMILDCGRFGDIQQRRGRAVSGEALAQEPPRAIHFQPLQQMDISYLQMKPSVLHSSSKKQQNTSKDTFFRKFPT